MQHTSAQERLDQLHRFVVHDLPRLCEACRNEVLPMAKLLRHARRQTAQISASIGLLDHTDRRLMQHCLAEILLVCSQIAMARGQEPNWIFHMLPDLTAALAFPDQPAGQPCQARIHGA